MARSWQAGDYLVAETQVEFGGSQLSTGQILLDGNDV
jgi:hypothetical protein